MRWDRFKFVRDKKGVTLVVVAGEVRFSIERMGDVFNVFDVPNHRDYYGSRGTENEAIGVCREIIRLERSALADCGLQPAQK